jgi:signal transduction histidine kinase/ActR/RegA family two-component response regulator
LLLLAAAGILPLAATAGLALLALGQERRAQTERSGLEITRALATAVDVELRRSIAVLQGISIGPALDTGNLALYHQSMRRTLETRPDWVTITLADPSGQQLLNARRPSGEPLDKVIDLPSLQKALQTRAPVVGGLRRGPRGELAVPVRVPVIRAGEIRYVLTAAVTPDAFVEVLNRQRLPEDWVVSVFDASRMRVARSRRHAEFINQPPSPSLEKMIELAKGDEATGVTQALEGDEIYTAFTRSAATGWTVAIGIPATSVRSAEREAIATYGAGLLVSLGLAALFSLLLARAVAAQEAEREALLRSEQQARAAAESASRAKDEFLAMLGHELRNPLGALTSASRLLQDARADPEMARHAREVVERQARHLARLTDDLLDAGRALLGKIVLQRRPLDLAAAVSGALSTLRAAGRLAAHRVRTDLESVWVDGDFARIEQIVANLVGNAVKYTPHGGEITVRVAREGAQALLSVSDTGAGMPAALLERVFEPFVQGERELDRSHGGLGIGLTLVRRLAQLHGGSASAESAGAGLGSRFTVALPAIEAPAARAPAEPLAPGAAPRDILLIEDNADAADMLRRLLEVAGHRVRVASDGVQGLATLREAPPDVALIDIGLPRMNGYEVVRQARASMDDRRRPLLVALTGYGLAEDRRRAIESGFDAHLVKPVEPAALEKLLASAQPPEAKQGPRP